MPEYINPEEPGFAVTQGFGARPGGLNPPGGHTGRDTGTPVGTKWRAPADCIVRFAGVPGTTNGSDNPWLLVAGGGKCLVLDSLDGKYAFVGAHLNAIHVKRGDTVKQGQHVADTGKTGAFVTGPHVHTEVMPDGWNLQNGTYGRINPDHVFKGYWSGAPVAALPNQRINGRQETYQRSHPVVDGIAPGAVGSNIVRIIPAGQLEVWEGYVHGQSLTINGFKSDIWFQDKLGFAWSGAFENSATEGLPDLTPRVVLKANERRAGPSGVRQRDKPAVAGSVVVRDIPGGQVEIFTGYVRGEPVTVDGLTTDIWYVDAKGFAWAGGFESQSVVGLPDLTVVPPPTPTPDPPVEPVKFEHLNGIDVANYQETAALQTLGADFILIKASEGGADWTDSALASNVAEARLTGKPVGFYHYARPMLTPANTAEEEARSFLNAIRWHLQVGDRVALDWEAENQDRTDWAEEWLDIVAEATKSTPLIYLNSDAINGGDWSKVEAKYPLWYAGGRRYGDTIEGFIPVPLAEAQVTWAAGVDLWQYTGRGRLTGYNGDLDFNVFYGDAARWAAMGATKVLAPPAPNPPVTDPPPPLTDDSNDSLAEFSAWLLREFRNRNKK